MKINLEQLQPLLHLLDKHELISKEEIKLAGQLAAPDFVFASQMKVADSIHYHIHVQDVSELPDGDFKSYRGEIVNSNIGYIKYAFPGNINLIFSHIDVAQREQETHHAPSYLDHIGIDIRSDQKPEYIIFQQIPLISSQNDFYFTRQGDGVNVVKCCHMQVKEKYWVYAGLNVNYEFALGPLVIHEKGFGVDLRPANPFNKAVPVAGACCSQPAPQQSEKRKIFV